MEPPSTSVRDERAPGWVEIEHGVRIRRMVEANGIALILYRIPPGTHFDRHAHPFAEVGVVLSGQGRCRFGGEVRTLHAGDAFYVPPDVPHDFTVEGTEPVVMLNTTVPLRSDDVASSADAVEELARASLPASVPGARAR